MTYLQDKNIPRLVNWVQCDDQAGNPATGGVDSGAFANFASFLSTKAIPAISAGVLYLACGNIYGLTTNITQTKVGVDAAGLDATTALNTRKSHEDSAGTTSYTDQISPALASLVSSLKGLYLYGAPPFFSQSIIDDNGLDYLTAIERGLGAIPAYDVLNGLNYDLTPPCAVAVNKLINLYNIKPVGEIWGSTGTAVTKGWYTRISGATQQAGPAGDTTDSWIPGAGFFNPMILRVAQIRPIVFYNASVSIAFRTNRIDHWLRRGVDIWVDLTDFSSQDLLIAVKTASEAAGAWIRRGTLVYT